MRCAAPANETLVDCRWHYLRGEEVVIVSHWRMHFTADGTLRLAVDGERAETLPLPRVGLHFRGGSAGAGELAGSGAA